jgi:hypothetical protein
MSGIADVSVEIQTKYDRAALLQAIQDFKDGKISADDLKQATDNLKSTVQVQNQAIREITQSYRVQNFQLNEVIRSIRSVHSLATDLNRVYQTQVLQQIQNQQQTQQQQDAYDNLSSSITNVVSALSVLGVGNSEVAKGLTDIQTQAKNLNSTQIQDIIDQIEKLKDSTKLTPDELDSLNQLEDALKKIKENTIEKQQAQDMQTFVGNFSNIAIVASSVGQFATNLKLMKTELGGIVGLVSGIAPELTAIMVLMFGEQFAEKIGLIQFAGDTSIQDTLQNGMPDIQSRFTGNSRVTPKPQTFKGIDANGNEIDLPNIATEDQLQARERYLKQNPIDLSSTNGVGIGNTSQNTNNTLNISVDKLVVNTEQDIESLGSWILDQLKKVTAIQAK